VDTTFIQESYNTLGPINLPQILLIADFILMIILWFTRQELEEFHFKGWGSLFDDRPSDSTVVIIGCVILFMIPVKMNNKWVRVLEKEALRDISWDILLILGGGFALAYGVKDSGLSLFISLKLSLLGHIPVVILVILLCTFIVFLTEFLSNSAIVSIVVPIIAELAVEIGQNPLLFIVPITISSSYAFMLPIATPPNAIIFSSDKLKVSEMMKTGIFLNIFGIVILSAGLFLLKGIFGIKFGVVPDWANITMTVQS